MLGLNGTALPAYLAQYFPEAEVHVVERDLALVAAAKEHCGLDSKTGVFKSTSLESVFPFKWSPLDLIKAATAPAGAQGPQGQGQQQQGQGQGQQQQQQGQHGQAGVTVFAGVAPSKVVEGLFPSFDQMKQHGLGSDMKPFAARSYSLVIQDTDSAEGLATSPNIDRIHGLLPYGGLYVRRIPLRRTRVRAAGGGGAVWTTRSDEPVDKFVDDLREVFSAVYWQQPSADSVVVVAVKDNGKTGPGGEPWEHPIPADRVVDSCVGLWNQGQMSLFVLEKADGFRFATPGESVEAQLEFDPEAFALREAEQAAATE